MALVDVLFRAGTALVDAFAERDLACLADFRALFTKMFYLCSHYAPLYGVPDGLAILIYDLARGWGDKIRDEECNMATEFRNRIVA